jgi:hypothetical protein
VKIQVTDFEFFLYALNIISVSPNDELTRILNFPSLELRPISAKSSSLSPSSSTTGTSIVVVVVRATLFDELPPLDGTVVVTDPPLDGTVVVTDPPLDGTVVVTDPPLDGTVVVAATYLIHAGLF